MRRTSIAPAALALLAGCITHDAKIPSPAGSYLLVACAGERTLEWREPWEGVRVERLPSGERPSDIAVAPRSSMAVVANRGDDTVGVYDLAQRTPPRYVELPEGSRPTDVAAHRTYAAFVACPGAGAVLEVQLRSARVSRTLLTGAGEPVALELSDSRDVLYVGHAGGEIVRVDARSGDAAVVARVEGELLDVARAYDTGVLWCAARDALWAVDLEGGDVARVEGAAGPFVAIAAHGSSDVVVAVATDGRVLLVDAASRAVVHTVQLDDMGGQPPAGVERDASGEFALVPLPGAGRVAIVDLVRRARSDRYDVGAAPTAVAWIREPRSRTFLGDELGR